MSLESYFYLWLIPSNRTTHVAVLWKRTLTSSDGLNRSMFRFMVLNSTGALNKSFIWETFQGLVAILFFKSSSS